MIGNQIERNIYIASRQAFAVMLSEATKRMVGQDDAKRLREEAEQFPGFKDYYEKSVNQLPYSDPITNSVLRSFLIGGLVMHNLTKRVKVDVLANVISDLLRDGDMGMRVIDICRKQQIDNPSGWGEVVDFNRKNAARMLGSLRLGVLAREQDEAAKEDPLSLAAYLKMTEMMTTGWMPLEYQAPQVMRRYL